PVGITLATAIAALLRVGRLPPGVRWLHVIGGAMLGGIGFTVALFITELSFTGQDRLLEDAKLGVFGGSLAAGIAGSAFLYVVSRVTQPAPESGPPVEPAPHAGTTGH